VNAIFPSGVYTWSGLYFARRYHLGEITIGLALLGYGVPGMLLGPAVGRGADRRERRWLVPVGLTIAAISAATLIPDIPLVTAALAVTTLSLGYNMTQPLLAGIVTSLDPKRGGQAMGLNVFALFTGFGVGSFLYQHHNGCPTRQDRSRSSRSARGPGRLPPSLLAPSGPWPPRVAPAGKCLSPAFG